MKLQNKKTGEIISSKELLTNEFIIDLFSKDFAYFNSKLNKIAKEWEDYEEPKDHWHIGCEGDVFIDNTEGNLKSYSSIGNDFETKEEAEKAVEKLKAWKRLKDKGFRFTDYDYTTYRGKGCGQVFFNGVIDNINEIKEDLDLLFGSGE